jgi:hypothetical protein
MLFACLVAVIAANPADAQRSKRKKQAEEPPPPVQFRVDGPTRPFELAQAQLGIPTGTVVGEYATDYLFCAEDLPVSIEIVGAALSMPDLKGIVAKEADAAGYALPGTARNMFETAEAAKADLLVGAMLKGIKIKGCAEPSLSKPAPGKMTATMTIEWQVFDPLEKNFSCGRQPSARARPPPTWAHWLARRRGTRFKKRSRHSWLIRISWRPSEGSMAQLAARSVPPARRQSPPSFASH